MMKNRIDLIHQFRELDFSIGAEIGVADGRFSLKLCQLIPHLTLYCVDPWAPYKGNSRGGGSSQHERNYALAQERLLPYGATLLRMTSMDAVIQFEDASLDFVYIDGNHDYAFVLDDITEWAPKVRPGGIVAGHDYYQFNNSGVIEAVNEYAQRHKIDVQIIGEVRKHASDDDQPTWYWVR
jgi:hypothetical protein